MNGNQRTKLRNEKRRWMMCSNNYDIDQVTENKEFKLRGWSKMMNGFRQTSRMQRCTPLTLTPFATCGRRGQWSMAPPVALLCLTPADLWVISYQNLAGLHSPINNSNAWTRLIIIIAEFRRPPAIWVLRATSVTRPCQPGDIRPLGMHAGLYYVPFWLERFHPPPVMDFNTSHISPQTRMLFHFHQQLLQYRTVFIISREDHGLSIVRSSVRIC